MDSHVVDHIEIHDKLRSSSQSSVSTSTMASEQPQEVLVNGHSTSQPPTPSAVKASVAALQSSYKANGGGSYDEKTALDDLPVVRLALQLFLESKMVESEDLLNSKDPVK